MRYCSTLACAVPVLWQNFCICQCKGALPEAASMRMPECRAVHVSQVYTCCRCWGGLSHLPRQCEQQGSRSWEFWRGICPTHLQALSMLMQELTWPKPHRVQHASLGQQWCCQGHKTLHKAFSCRLMACSETAPMTVHEPQSYQSSKTIGCALLSLPIFSMAAVPDSWETQGESW